MSKKISQKDKQKIRKLVQGMKVQSLKIKRKIKPIYDEIYLDFMSQTDEEIKLGKKKD